MRCVQTGGVFKKTSLRMSVQSLLLHLMSLSSPFLLQAKNVSQANELVAKLLAAEAKKRDGAEKTVLSSSSSPTQAKSVGKKSKRIVIEEMD